MKREFLQNIRLGDQTLPKEVIDAIMAENGKDIELAKGAASLWEEKYNQAVKDHEAKLADMAFDRKLEDAITGAKGKNAKAIKALLDVDTLKASKNQDADIKAAMDALQKDSGYLFGDVGNPPPYSPGAGTGGVGGTADGVTAAFAKLNPGLKI